MVTRFGVDVGGTFTDLIFFDQESGAITVGKGPSTPHSPDEGVVNVVREVIPGETLNRTELFLHGTTVGINAILERKGSKVGILTTDGFRDTLEFRRAQRRDETHHDLDLLYKSPPELVPRELRLTARGRIASNGAELAPLSLDDVKAAAKVFADEDIECVAIVFINAHANGAHELAAAKALRDGGYSGEISLSHDVSGEFSEYERTSTTVVDAYIRPKVARYLRELQSSLNKNDFDGEYLITVSGGGALTFSEAAERPFETVMSGPVAGVVGAAELCRQHGIDLAITGDVGGTSFDTALLVNGRPIVKYEGEVAGMPLQIPWVDVRSIGAGGGSIAYADNGLLQVGPQSAGAAPGPVCYRRGGKKPTTTDAAAVLGMLGFGELAGGMTLDIDGARAAIGELAAELGLDVTETAKGVIQVANVAMAQAIRSVSVELGQDPRQAALIQFGGAGPLFASHLALELGVETVIIPNYAGNFSAWGLLLQDLTRSAARTSVMPITEDSIASANEILGELFSSIEKRESDADITVSAHKEVALDMRFEGQEHSLTVKIPGENGCIELDAKTLGDLFLSEYKRTFGSTMDTPQEIVSVRATKRAVLPKASRSGETSKEAAEPRVMQAYSFRQDSYIDFQVIDRRSLAPGSKHSGPAIVTEQTSTTYVDSGFEIAIHEDGAMYLNDLERKA